MLWTRIGESTCFLFLVGGGDCSRKGEGDRELYFLGTSIPPTALVWPDTVFLFPWAVCTDLLTRYVDFVTIKQ